MIKQGVSGAGREPGDVTLTFPLFRRLCRFISNMEVLFFQLPSTGFEVNVKGDR